MRKVYVGGLGVMAALLIAGGVAGSLNDAHRQPALDDVDVKECNEYAGWIAQRKGDAEEPVADERLEHGAMLKTGTVEGLAEGNRENDRAADAYRRCMVRRGYEVWG